VSAPDPIGDVLDVLDARALEYVLIGGAAMVLHGSAQITQDVAICYARDRENIDRLVAAIAPLHPKLRVAGVPEGMPIRFDARFVHNGLNFTLSTDIGDIDLLGHVDGLGPFEQVVQHSVIVSVGNRRVQMLTVDGLILSKRAVNRTKDQLVLPELEAIREAEIERGRIEREAQRNPRSGENDSAAGGSY